MALAVTPAEALPFVRPDDVVRGAHLADVVGGELYCVVDLRVAERNGRQVRMAMLEDVVSEDIEPWEFGRLASLRRVAYWRDEM